MPEPLSPLIDELLLKVDREAEQHRRDKPGIDTDGPRGRTRPVDGRAVTAALNRALATRLGVEIQDLPQPLGAWPDEGGDIEAYLHAAYALLVGREPDAAGLEFHSREIASGRRPREAVLSDLETSAEAAAMAARAAPWPLDFLARQAAGEGPTREPSPPPPATLRVPRATPATEPLSAPGSSVAAGEILCGERNAFVRRAYRMVLGREAGAAGHKLYYRKLAAGRLSRGELLWHLRHSPEGEAHGVEIRGLVAHRFHGRCGRLPVLGPLYRWLRTLIELPRRLRQLEHTTADSQQSEQRLAALEQSLTELGTEIERWTTLSSEHAETLSTTVASEAAARRRSVATLYRRALEALAVERRTADNALERATQRLRRGELTALRGALQSLDSELKSESQSRGTLASFADQLFSEQQEQAAALADLRQQTTRLDPARVLADADSNDDFYVALEERFRGPREAIREHLKVYLPHLHTALKDTSGPLLDLGCGRGEWLQLLHDEGWGASGVDLNRRFVEQCRDHDLDVEQGDALRVLAARPAGSLAAVTAFHLAEHLPTTDLLSLLDQAHRVLAPGGLLLLETPNPENLLVGACNFHLDPTHRQPLPPLLLEFLLQARGFEEVEVLRLLTQPEGTQIVPRIDRAPGGELWLDFFGAMNYAVLGRRR